MNLDYITHYHLSDRQPFLTLSDFEGDATNPVFQEILNRHKTDLSYNRRYGENYLEVRKAVEEKLRKCFIDRGGKPTRKHPVYFVLGESKWFRFLNSNQKCIQIPISELPNDSVSVTFPDSYMTMSAKGKPYFEKVYFLNEMKEFISKYGIPKDEVPESYSRYWEGDFELYYEVQVWNDEILQPYLG
ncbi:hypothetical protein EOL70_10050 [Leucothrix sargassi]|nr:hypothetical protein EOL70_10050 [Leucothrix sargassi]